MSKSNEISTFRTAITTIKNKLNEIYDNEDLYDTIYYYSTLTKDI